MSIEAESKLAALVLEMEGHRDAARDFRRAGFLSLADERDQLLMGTCKEIRGHCRESGIDVPASVPTEADLAVRTRR